MSKIDEARDILEQLGLPPAQRNDISCLTLLALTGLSEDDGWSQADKPSRSIHEMLVFMRDTYGRDYAENTREVVRRQVIHQLEQARVVDRNPDEPDLPTNSPRTHYGLTDEALSVLRLYGTSGWESELSAFRASHGVLLEIYQRRRTMREIPIRTSAGEEIRLSPGRHNRLQAQVVMDFGPRFAPGATLLYLGDAAEKLLHLDREKLAELGVPITEHDKLPDVVLYDEERNWLFLVEAVTSHGPVNPKRFEELESTLKDCAATRVYVSAFPDFRQFKQHVDKIAWETEVWLAEIPDHLIHFNGDKFLGPNESI
jgi:type II restriction enzyme